MFSPLGRKRYLILCHRQPPGICSKYEPYVRNLKQLAVEVIGPKIEKYFGLLQLSQIVRLTAAAMEDLGQKTEHLPDFYKNLAITFGDPEGKFTPMASLYLTMYGTKDHRMRSKLISPLLESGKCNERDMEIYIDNWVNWLDNYGYPYSTQPCLSSNNASKCCGYFPGLLKKHFNMSVLAMSYAVPHFRINHSPLLKYLGLNDSSGLKYKAPIYNIVPKCQLPGRNSLESCVGENARAFDLVYSSKGICIGFNTPTAEEMYKVDSYVFQQ